MLLTKDYTFIHVPKTAGLSITAALETLIPASDLKDGRGLRRPAHLKGQALYDWNSQFQYAGHISVTELTKLIGPDNFSSRFSFAFVRNPWDRMLSLYHEYVDHMADHPLWKKHVPRYKAMGFSAWVVDELPNINVRALPPLPNQNTPLALQSEWITPGVNFVGRFETLAEDFSKICDHLNISCELPHKNKSNHKSYREVYSEEAKEKIAELFAEDIKEFNYEF